MLSTHSVLLFVFASLMLNLLPGPDMLYIIARTLSDDKRAGLIFTAGVSTGLMIHTLAATTGLSFIILQSAIAFTVIKLMGATYLIYMGCKMMFSDSDKRITESTIAKSSAIKVYQQGFLTNVLNPKVAVFFIAFLPQFVQPQRGHVSLQLMIFSILFIMTGTCVNAAVALLSNRIKDFLTTDTKFQRIQENVSGGILIAMGITLATYSKQT